MPKTNSVSKEFVSWLEGWTSYRSGNTLELVRSTKDELEKHTNILKEYQRKHRVGKRNPEHYLAAQLQAIKDSIDFYKKIVVHYETKYADALKKHRAYKHKHKVDAQEIYDQLFKHSDVDTIQVDGNQLVIETKDLKCEVDDIPEQEDYDRPAWSSEGKFWGRFQLRINQGRMNFTLYNMDYQLGNLDHCHIKEGWPCLGGYSLHIDKHDRDADLVNLIYSIIQYIKTAFTDGDCYANIWEFFDERSTIQSFAPGDYAGNEEESSDW